MGGSGFWVTRPLGRRLGPDLLAVIAPIDGPSDDGEGLVTEQAAQIGGKPGLCGPVTRAGRVLRSAWCR
jgi:hypothetical protein